MKKRHLVGMLTAVTLLASLITGTVVSGAQTAPTLSEVYVWEPYGLAAHYPADWTVSLKDQNVSLHPANRDVSDGLGPELVLFEIPDTPASALDATLETIVGNALAQHGAILSDTLDGQPSRSTSLTWTDTNAVGGLLLIALDHDQALGAAYIVRRSEAASYLPVLQAIADALSFEGTANARSVGTSYSVASVQLPQRYAWDAAGLALYFPAEWSISQKDFGTSFAGPAVVAEAPDSARTIQAVALANPANSDLPTLAKIATQVYGTPGSPTDVTVAGYPGVVYDVQSTHTDPASQLRTLTLDVTDQNQVVLIVFGTAVSDWDSFRPLASAFISSIEASGPALATLPLGGDKTPVARTLPEPASLRQQDTPTTISYLWEEYGITFNVPEGWAEIKSGQNFDLALISPDAMSSGAGAYLMFRVFAGLGSGTTMESTLQGLEDQVNGTEEPYSVAGLDGAHIAFTDDEAGTANQLILLPYGDSDIAVLYVQTSAPTDGTAVIDDILNSMVIDPPQVDAATIDAAWQASLAADGTLVYGNPDAPLHMIEYFSFSCSHCASYTLALKNLIALDVQTGRVQLHWAPIAGDDYAQLATETTYCATEQGKGFSTYEALFTSYLTIGVYDAYTQDNIDTLLEPIGVDLDALHACIEANTFQSTLDQVDQNFMDAGLTGTPTVLLAKGSDPFETLIFPDGTVWSGTIPIEILQDLFRSIIDDNQSIADAVTTYFNG